MANKRAKLAWSIMIVMLMVMLTGFGYYTYSSTIIHMPQEGSNKASLQPAIRVEENVSSAGRGVVVYLTLNNVGTQRLKLVDTVSLTPLYDIQLRVKAAGSDSVELAQPSGQNFSAMRNSATSKNNFDPQKDAVVDLIPGSALTRSIVLSSLYDLHRDGQYELTLAYQPESVTKGRSDIELVGAYTQRMSFVYTFSLPMKKPEQADDKGSNLPVKATEKPARPPEKH